MAQSTRYIRIVDSPFNFLLSPAAIAQQPLPLVYFEKWNRLLGFLFESSNSTTQTFRCIDYACCPPPPKPSPPPTLSQAPRPAPQPAGLAPSQPFPPLSLKVSTSRPGEDGKPSTPVAVLRAQGTSPSIIKISLSGQTSSVSIAGAHGAPKPACSTTWAVATSSQQ